MHATLLLLLLAVPASSAAGFGAWYRPVGASAPSRRLAPGVDLVATIPPMGSLATISGRLSGATPAPLDQYQICIYLESTASGESMYNGPKPFENEGSSSPVAADGTFNYLGWWANAKQDPEAVTVFVVAVQRSFGLCSPVLGEPISPETLPVYAAAAAAGAWLKIPRPNSLALAVDAVPPTGSAAPISGVVTGMVPSTVDMKVTIYRREPDGGLTGPLPGCNAPAVPVVRDGGDATRGTFRAVGWAGPAGDAPAYAASVNAAHLVLVLTPSAAFAATEAGNDCVADAAAGTSAEAVGLGLPANVLGSRLASVELARGPPAPPAPTPASPSPVVAVAVDASGSATSTSTPAPASATSTPLFSISVDVTIEAAASGARAARAGGAGALAAAALALAVAWAAAAAPASE